ncbi:MAG: DUF2161 family putative PD-(D/E)XK-type phosphodiesterase [Paenibacillaceae bacterium]
MAIKNETELYSPVKAYFESQGYEVKSEIKNCDLIAMIPGQSTYTIVELKKTFNLQLIFQAIDRLKLSDTVYVAIEYHPKKRLGSYFSWKDTANLCSKLNIGLIGVQFYKTKEPVVDVLCYPDQTMLRSKPSKRSKKVRAEFEQRSGDYNVGGSVRRKLITAFRERALRCAVVLSQHESMTVRELRTQLNDPMVASILQDNYYGWFERISRGRYVLTSMGQQALIEYAHVLQIRSL